MAVELCGTASRVCQVGRGRRESQAAHSEIAWIQPRSATLDRLLSVRNPCFSPRLGYLAMAVPSHCSCFCRLLLAAIRRVGGRDALSRLVLGGGWAVSGRRWVLAVALANAVVLVALWLAFLVAFADTPLSFVRACCCPTPTRDRIARRCRSTAPAMRSGTAQRRRSTQPDIVLVQESPSADDARRRSPGVVRLERESGPRPRCVDSRARRGDGGRSAAAIPRKLRARPR